MHRWAQTKINSSTDFTWRDRKKERERENYLYANGKLSNIHSHRTTIRNWWKCSHSKMSSIQQRITLSLDFIHNFDRFWHHQVGLIEKFYYKIKSYLTWAPAAKRLVLKYYVTIVSVNTCKHAMNEQHICYFCLFYFIKLRYLNKGEEFEPEAEIM